MFKLYISYAMFDLCMLLPTTSSTVYSLFCRRQKPAALAARCASFRCCLLNEANTSAAASSARFIAALVMQTSQSGLCVDISAPRIARRSISPSSKSIALPQAKQRCDRQLNTKPSGLRRRSRMRASSRNVDAQFSSAKPPVRSCANSSQRSSTLPWNKTCT